MENEISFGELTVNSDEVPDALFSTTTLVLLLLPQAVKLQVLIAAPATTPAKTKKEECITLLRAILNWLNQIFILSNIYFIKLYTIFMKIIF